MRGHVAIEQLQSGTRDGARFRPRSRFFLGLSAVLLSIVLIGFIPTLFLRPLFDVRPIPTYLHVHGAVMTGWFALLVLQTSLVATSRMRVHRRMGIAGAVLAVAIVITSLMAQLGKSHRLNALGVDLAERVGRDSAIFWTNIGTLLVFSSFVAAALLLRRRPEVHKRLLMLASINMMGPALGRIPRWPIFGGDFSSLAPLEGVVASGGVLLLLVVMLAYDRLSAERVHPATLLGCGTIVVARIVSMLFAFSATGRSLVGNMS